MTYLLRQIFYGKGQTAPSRLPMEHELASCVRFVPGAAGLPRPATPWQSVDGSKKAPKLDHQPAREREMTYLLRETPYGKGQTASARSSMEHGLASCVRFVPGAAGLPRPATPWPASMAAQTLRNSIPTWRGSAELQTRISIDRI